MCGPYVGYPDPLGLGQGSWNKIGRESATAVVLIALRLLCWGAVPVRNPRLLVEVEPGPANEALEYL